MNVTATRAASTRGRYGTRCVRCSKRLDWNARTTPLIDGLPLSSAQHPWNSLPCCAPCTATRKTRSLSEWLANAPAARLEPVVTLLDRASRNERFAAMANAQLTAILLDQAVADTHNASPSRHASGSTPKTKSKSRSGPPACSRRRGRRGSRRRGIGSVRRTRLLRAIFARDGHECVWCAKTLCLQTATIEHLLPHCEGGSEALTNLCAACGPCNHRRGSASIEAWMRQRPKTRQAVLVDLGFMPGPRPVRRRRRRGR